MEGTKSNDAGPVGRRVLAYEFGDQSRLINIRESDEHEFPKLFISPDMPAWRRISQYLDERGPSTVRDIAVDLEMPTGTIRRTLKEGAELDRFVRVGGDAKAGIWAIKSKRRDDE